MAKSLFKILIVFVVGAGGGIFADQILWPYFIERPLFHQYRLEQSPVYVVERKEITTYIQENIALKEALAKVEKVVVGVRTKTKEGEILVGSGLIVTSDGLMVTLADLLPSGSDFYFFVDGKWPAYQILKRDLKNNLALVKVEDGGLTTRGFADFEKLKLGERVFLIAMDFGTSTPQKIVNEGIVAFFNENSIQTNIFEKSTARGSPLFNIEGNIVGLNMIGETGAVSAIPVTKIREFVGL